MPYRASTSTSSKSFFKPLPHLKVCVFARADIVKMIEALIPRKNTGCSLDLTRRIVVKSADFDCAGRLY